MRIGVVSDTHGNCAALRNALQVLGEIDLVLHAGDILYHPPRLGCTEGYDLMATAEVLNRLNVPIIACRGNCDSEVYEELLRFPVQSPFAYASYEGTRILVSHGHLQKPDQLAELGHKMRVDFVVSGHTHLPVLERRDNVILMNPGSTSLPKYEMAGRPVPSVGLITDDTASVISIEDGSVLLEMQRR